MFLRFIKLWKTNQYYTFNSWKISFIRIKKKNENEFISKYLITRIFAAISYVINFVY